MLDTSQNSTFNADFNQLSKYGEGLNERLCNIYKVPENLRPLLVSGILIALQNNDFNKGGGENLAEELIRAITERIKSFNNNENNSELLECYNFIRTHKQLQEQDKLYELIEDIRVNVLEFIKKHEGVDVLGKFYTEFLKFANGDKSLGIVLTPQHIAEFFVSLTEVDENSVIIDSCTGTGVFLVAAQQKIKNKNSETPQFQTKAQSKTQLKTQLIGIEEQTHIFALSASNMIIHSNNTGTNTQIYHNSCFSDSLKQMIKDQHKPNVGMLNPPYRKKKKGISEWKFILNNLEMLGSGSKCAAIIPMSCVIAQKGEDLELKRELMKHHTLEAVFSMPDKLFYPASVITSIVLITAHKPNSKNHQTYLGYYKDDGFIMKRHKGRMDCLNKWNDIKKDWLHYFNNRIEKQGFSVMKHLTPEDEWCAESYLETDYSKLTQADFERVVREYMGYKLINGF